jgi:hypothetical protein
MKHFFNHTEINTTFGEYAVRREDGSCYPEMGTQRIYKFPNGYGASVVQHEHSYGGREGLFELTMLDSSGEICYSSPVTNGVIGWLTMEQVDGLLDDINKLSNRTSVVILDRVPTVEDLFG